MSIELHTHFSPGDEPYLGRNPLYVLDVLISSVLELSGRIADETHKANLTPLQNAAAQICPQGFNLSLAIRELLRQGHLFSSADRKSVV